MVSGFEQEKGGSLLYVLWQTGVFTNKTIADILV
jgi:hypothetical protein